MLKGFYVETVCTRVYFATGLASESKLGKSNNQLLIEDKLVMVW
jgi:hypothetical protein